MVQRTIPLNIIDESIRDTMLTGSQEERRDMKHGPNDLYYIPDCIKHPGMCTTADLVKVKAPNPLFLPIVAM
jgi:hypothetical protein